MKLETIKELHRHHAGIVAALRKEIDQVESGIVQEKYKADFIFSCVCGWKTKPGELVSYDRNGAYCPNCLKTLTLPEGARLP